MIEPPKFFPGQKPEEQIKLFVRKHWIKYAFVVTFSLIVTSVPLVLVLIYYFTRETATLELSVGLTLALSAYILILCGLSLYVFIDYYLDLLVVTQDKLIFIRQNGLFNRQFDEIHLAKIDEIGVDVKGILKETFDYGDLIIHSGTDNAVLTIDAIPDPERIQHEIMELHAIYAHSENGTERPSHFFTDTQ